MEFVNTRSQTMERIVITWSEIMARISHLKLKHNLSERSRVYGIPRGGQYLMPFFTPMDSPDEADYIIDDLIDSGDTFKRWKERYPNKKYLALINKQEDEYLKDKWIIFPWEIDDPIQGQNPTADIEANVRRILQYFDPDANREGLKETPKRYIKFLNEFLNP